jgi:hypothetical protein
MKMIKIERYNVGSEYLTIRNAGGKNTYYFMRDKVSPFADTMSDGPYHTVAVIKKDRLPRFLAHAAKNGVEVEVHI